MSEIDLDSLSLEDLARLANDPSALPPPVEQPRNPDGTFAAVPAPEVVTPPPTPDPEEELHPNQVIHNGELVYRVEVPGLDGAGTEVFYGHGADLMTQMSDVIRQQADAKSHANRKIRSMTQEQKKTVQLSDDEKYALAQRMQTDPQAVIDEIIERRLNSDPRIQAAEKISEKNQIDAVTNEWVAANPDFYASPGNGKRMWGEIRRMGIPGVPTLENITAAYQSLSADGLLQIKPLPDSATLVTPPPVVVPPPARRSSNLSTRSTVVPPAPPSAPTIEDAYNMPLEKLAELANRSARGL